MVNFLELAQSYHFYRTMERTITSYRALDLENDIAYIGFPYLGYLSSNQT